MSDLKVPNSSANIRRHRELSVSTNWLQDPNLIATDTGANIRRDPPIGAASPIRKIEGKDRTKSKSVAALPLLHEDFETPKARASVHPQVREGVVVVQKTAKIHLGSLINKLGLSTTALNRHDDGGGQDESSTKMFERQISVDSSRSSQNSESVSNTSHRDVIMKKSESKRQSIKKKHAPNPPNIPISQKVSTSTINGVLVGDYGSHSIRPPSSSAGFGNSAPVTSSYSGGNNFLFKIILFLLSTLLIANMLLFFRLYNLEARLIQPDDNSDGQLTPDPTLFFVKQGVPKTEEDWVKLVQRQEMLHQLELEKWHDLLGTATHLLRQTEESLTDLQRTIHPLALKKLRHLLFLQNTENPPDGVNMDSQDLHSSSEPEKVHHDNNNNNNNVENQSTTGGSESDVRSQKKVPISNDKREL